MFICPTRSRPHNMRRLIEACAKTGGLDIPWYVRVDEDDPRLQDYKAIQWPENWVLVIGETHHGCCGAYNEAFERHPEAPFFGHFADDIVPSTQGWAEKLISEAGSDGYAYGDDGIHGEKLGTHGVVGGDMARKLGWLSLPGVKRIYDDTALTVIARKWGVLRYRPDIKLTHLQVDDATFAKPSASADKEIYDEWLRTSPLFA